MEAGNSFHSLTSKICQQGDATVIRQQPLQHAMGSGCQRALENSALLTECQAVPWVGVTRLLIPKVPSRSATPCSNSDWLQQGSGGTLRTKPQQPGSQLQR